MLRDRQYSKSLLLAFAVTAALPALGAAQDSMPMRRPGLWETSVTLGASGHGSATVMCIDEALERRFSPLHGGLQQAASDCSKFSVHRNLTGFEMEETCKSNGHLFHVKSKTTGSFNSAYAMDMAMEKDGKSQPPVHMDAKWLGPCGDKKPGDIVINGRVVGNMGTMLGWMGK